MKLEDKENLFRILGRIEAKVEHLEEDICGNGLRKKVESLERDRNRLSGAVGALAFIDGILHWVFHAHQK
jgi:hypothetical protein